MAAMDRRKNVNESAETCVANLMKIALVPKANAATVRQERPLDNLNQPHANGFGKLSIPLLDIDAIVDG